MTGRTTLLLIISALYVNADLLKRIYFGILIPGDLYVIFYISLLNFVIFLAYNMRLSNSFSKTSQASPNLYLIFLCIAPIYIILFKFSGISFDPILDRSERDNPFFNSQIWVILYNVLMTIAFLCTYQIFVTRNRKIKILLFSVVVSIICIDVLGLGARRAAAIIALTILGHPSNTAFFFKRLMGIFLIITVIFLGLLVGAVREIVLLELIGTSSNLNVLELMLRNNEFTEIGNGLRKGILVITDRRDYLWGYSYILFPLFFIPRALFSDKPLSLTNEFQAATSPFVEGFYNFSFAGVFPVFLLFSYIFSLSRNNLFWGTFVFAYSFEILRSDFSVLAYNMIITALTIKILTCHFSQS